MSARVIHLHIGAPKTGTTFVQRVLSDHRRALAADGVLVPGRHRAMQVAAVRALLAWDPATEAEPGPAWQRLVAELDAHPGNAAVISQEFLCRAGPDRVAWLASAFDGWRIHPVLTTRDMARLVPAQWQTYVRQRGTRTLRRYANEVVAAGDGPWSTLSAKHFWSRQDYGAIVRRWAEVFGVENITVVTVPKASSDPYLLWRRFGEACGIDLEPQGVAKQHESLGAESAEVLRRLNERPGVRSLSKREYQHVVNTTLSRRVQAQRRPLERGLLLAPRHADWALAQSQRVIDELRATGVPVVGDLEDLVPSLIEKTEPGPGGLPSEDLLEAALDALDGLLVEHAKLAAKSRGGRPLGRQVSGGRLDAVRGLRRRGRRGR